MPHGRVRVDRQPGRFEGKKWPQHKGFTRFSVCSGASGIWKTLSPMRLGPVDLKEVMCDFKKEEDPGYIHYGVEPPEKVTSIENLWQFSKVWESEHDDKKSVPTRSFYERRLKAWSDKKSRRHSRKGAALLYVTWRNGQRMTYLEARKRIYCPIYARLVKETEAFKKLYKMVHEEKKDVLLVGYDGYDREHRSWEECLNDETRSFGHEMVLGALLDNEEPWLDK